MFNRINDLFRWFKEHFRDPMPGQATPGTPHGTMTSRTPYNGTPGVNGKFHINKNLDPIIIFILLKLTSFLSVSFFFRSECRYNTEGSTEYATRHVTFTLESSKSNSTSLSTIHSRSC